MPTRMLLPRPTEWFLRLALCGLIAISMSASALASAAAQIATATIWGTVHDATGASLPGATVSIKSTATGVIRSATTDAAGRYRVAALDPGEYEVRAELVGFKTAVQTGILLRVGGTTEADIALSIGEIAEEIT